MPDNISVTAGAGTIIAADDIGSVLYQRTKTTLGPDGTATGDWGGRAIGSTGAAAWVDPRPSTVNQVQNASGVANAAYAIGDCLGTGWTFTSMARDSGGTGVVTGIVMYDKNDLLASATLYFASASITFGTDNAAPSVSDTDILKIVGRQLVTFDDLGGARVACVDSIALPYVCDATSLFVYATTTAAAASGWAAGSDLQLRLAGYAD